LFNLADDPGEWINRASDPDVAAIEAALEHEITGGAFDLESIEKDIWGRLAQKQVVNQTMVPNGTSWDYRGEVGPSTQ
jgi:choline-sulfatase